jgi:DNA-binding NarL/FixJ family response regulator
MSEGLVTLMLVDDHAVVRAGYKRYIELDNQLKVVAEAATGEEACELLESVDVDLIIMDLSMPGQGGFETLRRIKNRLPQQKIIIFSMHENASLASQTLKLGADGYLTKSMAPDMLVNAIHEVMQGQIAIHPDLRKAIDESSVGDNQHKQLLPREFEIFTLLAQGYSIEEISGKLHLATKTVSNYQTNIRKTLGASSTLELQRYAKSKGIIHDL